MLSSSNGHFEIDLPLKKESLLNKVKRVICDPETGLFYLTIGSGITALTKFTFENIIDGHSHPIYLIGGFGLLLGSYFYFVNNRRTES